MKLLRISPGIYMSESGNVKIVRREFQNQEKPWLATWKGFMGETQRRFATLAEARKAACK